jgi:hypothetical protein
MITPEMIEAATPDQIERANLAVQANLDEDGKPKWESAQGYACALAAIIACDVAAMSSVSQPTEDDALAGGGATNERTFCQGWERGYAYGSEGGKAKLAQMYYDWVALSNPINPER